MRYTTCGTCGQTFYGNSHGRPRKFCYSCAPATPYGSDHQRLRKRTLPTAYGQPCCRCGDVMEPGQELHLDHNDNGDGYRGWAHAACNTSAGAAKGNRSRAATKSLWTPASPKALEPCPTCPRATPSGVYVCHGVDRRPYPGLCW